MGLEEVDKIKQAFSRQNLRRKHSRGLFDEVLVNVKSSN
jgi:hypothetical protein